MPIISEMLSSVERSSGGNTPEGSCGHLPMRLSEVTAIQQVSVGDLIKQMLDINTCSWPSGQGNQKSCAHQATSVSYLGSVEEFGHKVRMNDFGSCEEHDEPISGQV